MNNIKRIFSLSLNKIFMVLRLLFQKNTQHSKKLHIAKHFFRMDQGLTMKFKIGKRFPQHCRSQQMDFIDMRYSRCFHLSHRKFQFHVVVFVWFISCELFFRRIVWLIYWVFPIHVLYTKKIYLNFSEGKKNTKNCI